MYQQVDWLSEIYLPAFAEEQRCCRVAVLDVSCRVSVVSYRSSRGCLSDSELVAACASFFRRLAAVSNVRHQLGDSTMKLILQIIDKLAQKL